MDMDRIKRNVAKMASQNAPEEDIDGYISSEGATVDMVRNHKVGASSAAPHASLSSGEMAADVAKSAGIGVAQGAIGFATLPGNIEQLGRIGIDKAAQAVGMTDPGLSKKTLLPTYQDAKQFVEGYTGQFYEPKSTAGEYVRTIGEFAPMAALGPGGAAVRAANVVGPALASETAGQITKGTEYEPYARAAGALAGGFVPNAAMRAVTPVTSDAARVAQVATLENEGVTALTAGQRTGNRALRWAESAANDAPFSGGRGTALNNTAAEQFTAAALRRAGVNANRATPDVIDGAFRDLGQQFDQMAAATTVRLDGRFRQQIANAVQDYNHLVPVSQRAPVIDNLLADLRDTAHNVVFMGGERYQSTRSMVERLRRGSSNDPQRAQALANIREALDDAMGRSLPAPSAQQWRQVRGQYRNLLSIEDAIAGAGENAAMGLISPSALRNAVKKQGKRAYVRGRGDLGPLARAGEAIMKPLPQSGTAPRIAAQSMLDAAGAATGALTAGAPGAVLGAVAPRVGQGMMARALMSGPMQNYLSNNAMTPVIEAYNAARLPAAYYAPNAMMQIANQPLRGGIGPRYDENGNRLD